MGYAFKGNGRMEILKIFISLANAVPLGIGRILDVGYAPRRIAHQLECRAAFALLVALELHIIVFILYLIRSESPSAGT